MLYDFGTNILTFLLAALSLPELRCKKNFILILIASIFPTFIDPFNSYAGTFSAVALMLITSAYATWPNFKKGITTIIISLILTGYTLSFASYISLWILRLQMTGTLTLQNSLTFSIVEMIFNYILAFILYLLGKWFLKYFQIPDDPAVTNIKFYSTILLFICYITLVLSIRDKSYQITYMLFTLFLISLLFIGSIITTYLLITSHYQHIKAQNELQQSKDRLLYIQELESDYQKLQSFKQDYKILLTSISQSIENNDTSNKTLNILLKSSTFETVNPNKGRLYHLNDVTIRNTIITKIMEAKSENITVDYEIDSNFIIPKTISKKLDSIIDSLLKDAIMHCKDLENAHIKMALTKSEQFLEVIIKNDIKTDNLQQTFQKDSAISKIKNLISKDTNYLLQTKLNDNQLSSTITIDCGVQS